MSRRKIIILIVFIILAVFGIFLYFYIQQITPKYDWTENYSYKSKEPYGTKLLYELLKRNTAKGDFNTIDKSIVKQLPLNSYASNYFFIGNFMMEDTAEMQYLLNYVGKGNKAFLFTNKLPEYLITRLTDKYFEYNNSNDSIIKVYFPDDTNRLAFKFRFLKNNVFHNWNFIDNNFFNDSLQTSIDIESHSMTDDGNVNYFSIKYGKGTFYFNSIPLMFTNYHIIRDEGFKNAKKCFSYFNDGSIYWDEKNKITTDPVKMDMPDSSPLRYILSQKNFSWAWYIGIATVLLYVFFRSKREQRIIPVINPTKNTSLEFNKAISYLYFQTKDNTIIADEIMKMFLLFIKNKYGIIIQLNKYEVSLLQLAERSGISDNHLSEVFQNCIKAKYGDKTDKVNLVNFHHSIEYFYKNCK